jgi:hypothetical protein
VAALSAVLLDFASKLRALAVDGIVEGSAQELAGAVPLRTFRYRLAALVEARVLTRENAQGGRVRLAFAGAQPRTATENGNSCRSEEPRTARTATGGGRGRAEPSSQTKDATREVQQQQQAEQVAVLEGRTARTATLPEGWIRVVYEGPAHLLPRPVHLEPIQSSPEVAPEVEPEPEEPDLSPQALADLKEAVAWRSDQQAKGGGFRKSRQAFERDLMRKLKVRPREVKEIIDEKREALAATTPASAAPRVTAPVPDDETPAQAKERLARIERDRMERTRGKILANRAAVREATP